MLGLSPNQPRVNIGYVPGNWYPGILPSGGTLSAGAGLSDAVTRLLPFTVRETVTITDLGALVTTLSAAGLFRLGIYEADPATHRATGTPIATVSGLSTNAAVAVSGALASPVTLYPARLYWAATQTDNATVRFLSIAGSSMPGSVAMGHATLGTAASGSTTGILCTSAGVGYAAGLPDMTAETQTPTASSGHALLWWKAAA